MSSLHHRVGAAQRWLERIYGLERSFAAADFVIEPERARALLPGPSPRSGVLVVDGPGDEVLLGLYLDPRDAADPASIVEETSHLLLLAWHAARGRGVSRLHLELQGEVDRYAFARLAGGGAPGALAHFRGFSWADWMDPATRRRYETAHRAAARYCAHLERRYPRAADTPSLVRDLRRYYRAPQDAKLRAAA